MKLTARLIALLGASLIPCTGNAALLSEKTLPSGLECKWFAQSVPFTPGVDSTVGICNPDSGFKPLIRTFFKIDGWGKADKIRKVVGGACSIGAAKHLTLVTSGPINRDIKRKIVNPGWQCFAAGEEAVKTVPMTVMVIACK